MSSPIGARRAAALSWLSEEGRERKRSRRPAPPRAAPDRSRVRRATALYRSERMAFVRLKRAEARAACLADADSLTGLPKRARLREMLAQMLAEDARPIAALVDFDDVRRVNGADGRDVGDPLSKTTAERLQRRAGPRSL